MLRAMNRETLFEHVIAAHGGRDRWNALESIEARFDSSGLAFSAHMQPTALRNLRIAVRPHARQVVLGDFHRPGWRGVWTPERVQVFDAEGRLVEQRDQPRASFSRPIKLLRWDRLDILYFAGYALWNYLGFPFILEEPGVRLNENGTDRLVARFDASVPTHSPIQEFHIDAAGHLLRHDYTADVIGRWARAANLCLASEVVDGLRFYTRRRVYPRIGTSGPIPFPTLVRIDIDDIGLTWGARHP